MKKLAVVVLLFVTYASFGQDLVGRKIINGNVYLNLTSISQNSFYDFNTSFLGGKIKSDLSYWAFGGQVIGRSNGIQNNPQNYTGIGPAVQRGKFINLIDKLYLAPYGGANLSLLFGTGSKFSKGINFGAAIVPIRFMYNFNEKFLLAASFGELALNLKQFNGEVNVILNGNLNNSSSIGVFYTFK